MDTITSPASGFTVGFRTPTVADLFAQFDEVLARSMKIQGCSE